MGMHFSGEENSSFPSYFSLFIFYRPGCGFLVTRPVSYKSQWFSGKGRSALGASQLVRQTQIVACQYHYISREALCILGIAIHMHYGLCWEIRRKTSD